MMQAGREIDNRNAHADLIVCEAATKGPWYATTNRFASEVTADPEGSSVEWICQLWYKDEEVMQNHELNARFIAEAREALPYWIQRAVAAEIEARRFREALEKVDIHIRSTSDPVPYIIETLKSTLPEYKDWWDIGE